MKNFDFFRRTPIGVASLTALSALSVSVVQAQTAPDSGQVLREQTAPSLQGPRPASSLRLVTPPTEPTLPNGAKVRLKSVRVQGNTVLSEAQLLAALGDVAGQSFDMAGLRGLAERVAATYLAAGYPFARAILPQQDLSSGQLTVEVIEGRYGAVKATGETALATQAQGFLSGLRGGEVIETRSLERATLLLEDQPGVKTAPVMRPGAAFGTGDLEVNVQRTAAVRGDVGFDNHGNRYTGEHRLRANVFMDSPFLLGDQVQLSGLVSSEELWLGSLGYSLPLGGDGWRANVGYAHTSYELGKEFANAKASGSAKVTTLGASYPVLRSQAMNLTLGISAQHKDLDDQSGVDAPRNRKAITSWPLSAQFDAHDSMGGGGVTYGGLVLTHGRLQLDAGLTAGDEQLNTRGSFNKWNLDLARIQATPVPGLSLFGRVSTQSASKNLDSSEKFGLGGAGGVRAYPTGEGYGDKGWLMQLEARYTLGAFSPYAFYDTGSVRTNAKPLPDARTNKRSVAGTGLGTRYERGNWSADVSVAWRTKGGEAEDANSRRNPRVWMTGAFRF